MTSTKTISTSTPSAMFIRDMMRHADADPLTEFVEAMGSYENDIATGFGWNAEDLILEGARKRWAQVLRLMLADAAGDRCGICGTRFVDDDEEPACRCTPTPREAEELTEDEELTVISQWRDHLLEHALRSVKWPARSTSAFSNLAEQAKAQTAAELAEKCEWVLS